jgi:hypothetical protein
MLWVWHVDDDLRFLTRNEAGVAWLAMTIFFDGAHEASADPRTDTLRLPPGLYEMPVIRLERNPQTLKPPAWSAEQRASAARMIVDLARITHANALQIDFDAPESARPFYRALVADVRRELGPDVFLSVTALLSWCATPHSWLDNLLADEIVPMAFDPGVRPGAGVPAGMEISWPDPVCRKSVGIGVELPR